MNYSEGIVKKLQAGGVGIIAADTIYGISARALDPHAVEKIYKILDRDPNKALITLIADCDDVKRLNLEKKPAHKMLADKYWPGKLSMLFPVKESELRNMRYLHRDTNHVAIRMPDKDNLRELIRQVGPIVSTSANPPGLPPATSVDEVKDYFGDVFDFYSDEDIIQGEASTLVAVENGEVRVLREGAVSITN